MFRRFFVPLDGSARSENAIPVAARLAHAVHGTVTLAHVIMPVTSAGEYGVNILSAAAETKVYLNSVMERYGQELAGIHLVLEAAPGTLPPTLFELSDQEHSDLIVMCSRGDTWLKRWVFDSVAQATFRRSHLPLLVLNEHGMAPFLEGGPLRILVPLDGSELAETVLDPVFQLLSIVSAPTPHKIQLFQVIAEIPATGRFRSAAHVTDTSQKEEREETKAALQALARHLSRAKPATTHCVITSSVVVNPDVAGTIVKHARTKTAEGTPSYDMIALTTHGRTGFKRAILGSVTEHVFGASSLPLLVVYPSTAESGGKQGESENASDVERHL